MGKHETGTRHALLQDRPVTTMQASRLAPLSGMPQEELEGQTLFTVHRKLQGMVDPELLSLRKVSGRVVRWCPVHGTLEAVDRATVSVEDTDASFLLYSPPQWADWSWFHPYQLRREVIATARTDANGQFAVYLPRWEIQAISDWRQGRIGLSDFSRPRLRDIVRDLDPERPREPLESLKQVDLLARCRRLVGRPLADQIEAMLFGQGPAPSDETLEMLLETPVAPERPNALTDLLQGALQAHVAAESLLEEPASVSPIGTVWHRHLALKSWTLLLDVPDITFRVTRTDERGGEEVLYSDGFFDVPWSHVNFSGVTLTAPASASASSPSAWAGYEALPAEVPAPQVSEEAWTPRFDGTTVF